MMVNRQDSYCCGEDGAISVVLLFEALQEWNKNHLR